MKVTDALSKTLFWDVNPEKLDWQKDKQFMIERTFDRGGMKDDLEIYRQYTLESIIDEAKKNKNMNNVTHNFY